MSTAPTQREAFRDPHGPEFFAPAPTPAELRAAKEAFDRQWRRAYFDWGDPSDQYALTNYGDPSMRGFRAGYAAGLAAADQAAIEAAKARENAASMETLSPMLSALGRRTA